MPSETFYFRNDQWLRRESGESASGESASGAVVTLGLTPYGANELGELVFAELPGAGTQISANGAVGVVESVKAVAEILSPVAGTVLESNAAVAQTPSLVNDAPLGAGWIVRLQTYGALPTGAMSEAQYTLFRNLSGN